jgi:iron complex outermembrane recepter protein
MKVMFTKKYKVRSTKYKNQVRKVLFSLFFSLFSFFSFSQEKLKDTTQLDEVVISSIRANKKTPVSFSNLTKEEFSARNLGQDIPVLMNFMPSVVTTSDAGNGFGYTGIRVRGSDATRVNVTINGIPYNDAESSGTFWVNMPDFASSVESLQLQRGVGTSTNGAGTFGASLNMLTENFSEKASAEISNSFGSFNSRKHTLKFNTGLLNNNIEISGRVSKLYSDGYVDRAFSDLKSYFFQGVYKNKSTLIKALIFGGKEKTYQSWYGVDAQTLQDDRTFNYAGYYTDESGNARFYDNQTDNYQQDHGQLIWNEKINSNWSTNLSFHYTKGKGYYEEYADDSSFEEYNIQPILGEISTDAIRQKWLDNNFYGAIFSSNYKKDKVEVILGSGINKYEGKHFGKLIWAQNATNYESGQTFYNNFGNKIDFNLFSKLYYKANSKLLLFGDLQYRAVGYKANGLQTVDVNDEFNFFNPKAGLTYTLNTNSNLYFSVAVANREPNRTDYENGNPKPEKLIDYELGFRLSKPKTSLNANVFYMNYTNQLILTGALDDVGNPIRANSGKSYRLGLELDALVKLSNKVSLQPNITLSSNKIIDYIYDNGTSLNNLGNTEIAYSPSVLAGNILNYQPIKNFQISLLSKFVGEQFLSNTEDENAKLNDYFVQDVNISYSIPFKTIFKSIEINGLVNNIFSKKYNSNGADYGGGYVYYFPQAGINFLIGVNLKF